MQISYVDLAIVLLYLLGITVIGVVVGRRQTQTSTGYFLAGRSLGWMPVGLALFATNISTIHLIGLAASGYSDGMAVGNFEWMAPFLLILLGLVFAPFYFRTKVSTLPEYLEGRYSPAARTVLAVMAVFGALFAHIGVSLYAGAVVVKSFVDIPIVWAVLVVSLLTVIYTVAGGLKAVVITESIQTVLLLLGAVAVTLFGLIAVGHQAHIHSWTALQQAAKPGQLHVLRSDGPFAWYYMVLGYPVLGIWYWCSDQTIVQRVLGAKTERDAQLGPIFCGFLKILTPLVMILPGVLGYVLFKDKIQSHSDEVLSLMIKELLPVGLQGVVIAGLLAALMSTVAGALNSTATLVSIDIVQRLRPDTSDRTLVRIGQVTAVVVMCLAVLWSMQGEWFGGIFKGVNQMISVLAPPISVVFIWGIFWRRATARAALATLIFGFLLGAAVFVVDFPAVSRFVLGVDANGEARQLLTKTLGMPFMLQTAVLFAICSVVLVLVSLWDEPPPQQQVERFCWKNPLAVLTEKPLSSFWDPRILALLLTVVMGVCYYIFA